LFFEYPTDNNLYVEELCDTQFLIGPDIMAAPIVEQGKTSRNVYFPLADWYDLHTGTLYKNGTSTISNVQITDKVPLFIRIGTAVLLQDTTTVRQTKDLGNVFRVVGAFFLDTRRSNSTVKYYRSSTSMIGIKDYNDQNKIATCISQGCEYVFNMLLTQA
jgi:alpha-glucosidase (family GH31 glycosyl hydrolase)